MENNFCAGSSKKSGRRSQSFGRRGRDKVCFGISDHVPEPRDHESTGTLWRSQCLKGHLLVRDHHCAGLSAGGDHTTRARRSFGLTQDDYVLDEGALGRCRSGVIRARPLLLHLLLGAVCGQSDFHPLHLGGRTRHTASAVNHSCGEQGEKDQDGHDAGHCGDGRIDPVRSSGAGATL